MKREDRAKDPAPAGDFNRKHNDATSADLVAFLTTYSRMTVTPEEHEKVLLRIYGPDRLPGTDSRRRSQMGLPPRGKSPREPKPHGACEQCGEPLTWGLRFCSRDCWHESKRPGPMTNAEIIAEMRAAIARSEEYLNEEREE